MSTTYLISLAIQIAAVVAVVVVVVLLVRPRRSDEQDELSLTMERLREDVSRSEQETAKSINERTARSSAELQRLLSERLEQLAATVDKLLQGQAGSITQIERGLGSLRTQVQDVGTRLSTKTNNDTSSFELLRRAVRDESANVRARIQALEQDLLGHLQESAAARTAPDDSLPDRPQAACDFGLADLTAALDRTEARLAEIVRERDAASSGIQSELQAVSRKLDALATLVTRMKPTRPAHGAHSQLADYHPEPEAPIPVPPGPTDTNVSPHT